MARWLILGLIVTIAGGCALGEPDASEHDHFHGDVDQEEPYYDELADSAGTVRQQLGRCSTAGVMGLAEQIVDEMRCWDPGLLDELHESDTILFTGPAVMPYFTPEAVAGLESVSTVSPVEVRSGYRTVVQQYLIRAWKQAGRCGIRAAAKPGESSHESGRAIDIQNYASVRALLEQEGWVRTVSGDPIHFAHLASADLSGLDVLAFQRLWNRNHPEEPIAEDGDFGGATAWRIERSPAAGFAAGSECSP